MPDCIGYELPHDVHAFYAACGGLDLYTDRAYGVHVVPPAEFAKANPVIRGCVGDGDISCDWFIIGMNAKQYITIDLGMGRAGRCYDSFWDRHALPGDSPIIAMSFSELLVRLIAGGGGYWYWLREDFISYGDAYGAQVP